MIWLVLSKFQKSVLTINGEVVVEGGGDGYQVGIFLLA